MLITGLSLVLKSSDGTTGLNRASFCLSIKKGLNSWLNHKKQKFNTQYLCSLSYLGCYQLPYTYYISLCNKCQIGIIVFTARLVILFNKTCKHDTKVCGNNIAAIWNFDIGIRNSNKSSSNIVLCSLLYQLLPTKNVNKLLGMITSN